MISFKSIQTTFITTKHDFFLKSDFCSKNSHHSRLSFFCKSKNSDTNSSSSSSESSSPDGDSQKQELLARIAMLQAQKVRLTDYLDERSDYLTNFAEEANAEFDQVGENALKELEEASSRIMGNIESQMQAFEESAESNKLEIEENEKKINEFETRFQNEVNEGLFFKNLGGQSKPSKSPVEITVAKGVAEKMTELNKQTAGTETRRNIYLVLIGLISVSLFESLVSSSFDWRKGAVLGVILVGLVAQLTYERKMLAETKKIETEKNEDKQE